MIVGQSQRSIPAGGPALIGRAYALAVLERAMQHLRAGRFHAVSITGEPGIGKSRLLAELRVRARESLIRAGRATEHDRRVPYAVMHDALDDWPPAPAGESRQLRHRGIRRMLEELAGPNGLVLLLDDLHWADAASIELLGYLLRHPPEAPVLLAVAYRPRQADARLADALTRSVDSRLVEHLELPPLTATDTAVLLGRDVDDQRKRALHDASGGNPLYLEALLRRDARGGALPALAMELHGRDATTRLIAQAAAVVGDPFDIELVAEAAGEPEEAVLAGLDELLRLDVVRPAENARRFRFRHRLLRQAVHEATPQAVRRVGHARAAKALERRGAALTVRARQVEHAAEPGDQAAIELLTRAAHETAVPADAARWYETALALLPHDVGAAAQRAELMLAHGRALGRVGDLPRARDVLHGTLSVLSTDRGRLRLRAVRECATVERLLGRHHEARALLVRELASIGDHETPEAAAVKLELTATDFYDGNWSAELEPANEAFETARRLGDRALEACAAGQLAASHGVAGTLAEATRWCDHAATLLDGLYDSELADRVDALYWTGLATVDLERFTDSLRFFDRALALSQVTGPSHLLVLLYASKARALRWLGRTDELVAAGEAAVEAALRTPSAELRALALGERARGALQLGDRAAAVRDSEQALRLAARAGGLVHVDVHSVHAAIRSAAAEAGIVDDLVRSAGGPDTPAVGPLRKTFVYELLATAELQDGNVDTAANWATKAEENAAACDQPLHRAAALFARAKVLLAQGEPAEAAAHAQRAVALAAGTGARYEVARGQLLAGQAFVAAGERDRAARCLEEAAITAASCRASRLSEEILATVRQLGSRGRRATSPLTTGHDPLAALTRRERQVAALVAEGSTNRQIADVLQISERTVETHVANILDKVGADSRAAIAAAWASRGPK